MCWFYFVINNRAPLVTIETLKKEIFSLETVYKQVRYISYLLLLLLNILLISFCYTHVHRIGTTFTKEILQYDRRYEGKDSGVCKVNYISKFIAMNQSHNTNASFSCRIRPLSSEEVRHGFRSVITATDEYTLSVDVAPNPTKTTNSNNSHSNHTTNSSNSNKKTFDYDRVFGPEESQEKVFDDVEHLIQSAIDGYNVCIFAYGTCSIHSFILLILTHSHIW